MNLLFFYKKCSFACVCAFFVVPSDICLGFDSSAQNAITIKANSPVATFAQCSPYYSAAPTFCRKIRLRLLNMLFTLHSHKQASIVNVNAYSIDKSIIFLQKVLALLAYVHFLLYLCSRIWVLGFITTPYYLISPYTITILNK